LTALESGIVTLTSLMRLFHLEGSHCVFHYHFKNNINHLFVV